MCLLALMVFIHQSVCFMLTALLPDPLSQLFQDPLILPIFYTIHPLSVLLQTTPPSSILHERLTTLGVVPLPPFNTSESQTSLTVNKMSQREEKDKCFISVQIWKDLMSVYPDMFFIRLQ